MPLLIDFTKAYIFTAILTAVIETFFLGFFYRDKKFLFFVVIANISSNFILNIYLTYHQTVKSIVFGEIFVVFFEFIIFYLLLKNSETKLITLFVLTILANCLSYSIGLLIFKIW